jgi:hypothetical protein
MLHPDFAYPDELRLGEAALGVQGLEKGLHMPKRAVTGRIVHRLVQNEAFFFSGGKKYQEI